MNQSRSFPSYGFKPDLQLKHCKFKLKLTNKRGAILWFNHKFLCN